MITFTEFTAWFPELGSITSAQFTRCYDEAKLIITFIGAKTDAEKQARELYLTAHQVYILQQNIISPGNPTYTEQSSAVGAVSSSNFLNVNEIRSMQAYLNKTSYGQYYIQLCKSAKLLTSFGLAGNSRHGFFF